LQSILHQTRGIVFLGTPHHHVGLARCVEMLAEYIRVTKLPNPPVSQLLYQASEDFAEVFAEVFAETQYRFYTMIRARNTDGLQPIEITCFCEELPLLGVGLVSEVKCLTSCSHDNFYTLGRPS
jgi:protein SERAC1